MNFDILLIIRYNNILNEIFEDMLIAFLFFINICYGITDYIANYQIENHWNEMMSSFSKIQAYENSQKDPPLTLFLNLNKNFKTIFAHIYKKPNYQVVYDTCLLQTEELSKKFDRGLYRDFLSNCFYPLQQIINEIKTNYTVKADIKAYPQYGSAPLTVTFDGRGSIDPTNTTIPINNYYWYFRDNDGNLKPIGKGPLVSYTFTKANTYIVYLTVKSVNKGVLDGQASISITVNPEAAKVVIYAGNNKLSEDKPLKIGRTQAQAGIVLDATATQPRQGTKIIYYKVNISGPNGQRVFDESGDGAPSRWLIKFPGDGVYKVNILLKNNIGEEIQKVYNIIVSDPVAIIKVNPDNGNTKTEFTFDSSASYSVISRIAKVSWTIYDPNGKIVFQSNQKSFSRRFIMPGTYTINLKVTDELGQSNEDTLKLDIESFTPIPEFKIIGSSEFLYPSEFILDASGTYDEDVLKNVDQLSYEWNFSNPNNVKIIKTFDNGKKILINFEEVGNHSITLRVKDKFGKIAEITKSIEVVSTLRPRVFITPLVTNINEKINIKVDSNKTLSYIEIDFGNGKIQKTNNTSYSISYDVAGIYNIKFRFFTPGGEYNEIKKIVFIGQKGEPILAYRVFSDNIEKIPEEICVIEEYDENKKQKIKKDIKAYSIYRYEKFYIDGTLSRSSQGDNYNLSIYFKDSENRNFQNIYNGSFDEIGCQYVDIYVEDYNINKISSKRIRFKVKNSPPSIDGLMLQFPQYGNEMGVGFGQEQMANAFDIIYDPLIVKPIVTNPKDNDGFVSYYRWYYYNVDNPDVILGVKITPSNVPYTIFSIPRIPGKYMFGVEICDNDGDCKKSEEIIGQGPTVFFPPSDTQPDIPIVTLVVNPIEVKVGEEVNFEIKTEVLGDKKNFQKERIIKIDFDGDGEYDITTKKTNVTYIYNKPGEYKPRVKVIFRGYAGVGYGQTIFVKKGIKPNFLYDYYDKHLIVRDITFGEIEERTFCLDHKKCDDKKFVKQNLIYFDFDYQNYGRKIITYKVLDKYGMEETMRQVLNIEPGNIQNFHLLSIPKIENNEINVGKNLDNSVLYKLLCDNCYMDPDISSDEDKDGKPDNDKIILPNKLTFHKYNTNASYTYAKIIGSGFENTIKINFIDNEDILDPSLKDIAKKIDEIIDKENFKNNENLKTLLVNLRKSLGDKTETDELILQISDYLDQNSVDKELDKKIREIIIKLADDAIRAAMGSNEYLMAKQEILLFFPENQHSKINQIFQQIETMNLPPDSIKKLLSEILGLAAENLKAGEIDEKDYQIILQNICKILKYYNITSEKCGDKKDITQTNTNSSIILNIVKIFVTFVGVLIVLFILLVIIFAIKAKLNNSKSNE